MKADRCSGCKFNCVNEVAGLFLCCTFSIENTNVTIVIIDRFRMPISELSTIESLPVSMKLYFNDCSFIQRQLLVKTFR